MNYKNSFKLLVLSVFVISFPSFATGTCDNYLEKVLLNKAHTISNSMGDIPGRKLAVRRLGMKQTEHGTHFEVWLPHAKKVEIITKSTNWSGGRFPLKKGDNGIFYGDFSRISHGERYKLKISDSEGHIQYRIDPYSTYVVRDSDAGPWESVVWSEGTFKWTDKSFVQKSENLSFVEVHPGTIIPGNKSANFREIADFIVEKYKDHATHVSLMPITHHNVYESWGYQPGAIFSTDFRHGTPDDLRYLVNKLHENDMGVVFDVVHGHTSKDWDTGLGGIDGTDAYFKDGYLGNHPEWGTNIYDFGRDEVGNYLLSNMKYFIEEFHIDGARFDGIASMRYLNYGRTYFAESDPIDHEALRYLRDAVFLGHKLKKGFLAIAEDSSGDRMTSLPYEQGGIGFDYNWNIGMMQKWRAFLKGDAYNRDLFDLLRHKEDGGWGPHKYINYINSHDEASNGKKLIIEDISIRDGDNWYDKVNIFRMMMTHLYVTTPGHPMFFMGDEFVNTGWWNENTSPKFNLEFQGAHEKFKGFMKNLKSFRENENALRRTDLESVDVVWNFLGEQVAVHARHGKNGEELLIIHNFNNQSLYDITVPVTKHGRWKVEFTSSEIPFGEIILDSFDGDIAGEKRPAINLTLNKYTSYVLKKIN